MNKINIFFSSDENYTQHLAVSIASILCNAGTEDELIFSILDGGISEKSKFKINKLKKIKNFEIEYIPINEDDFKNYPLNPRLKHITLPTYYRFKIASLKPNLEKAIYLDCDIVVKTSLKELWETDIANCAMGVIEDCASPKSRQEFFDRLGCDSYFNAGILLINIKKWNELNLENKCFELVGKEKEKLLWNDQDILNLLFQNNVKFLHPKWNFQTNCFRNGKFTLYSQEEINQALKKPSIIHYTNPVKPWSPHNIYFFEKDYFLFKKEYFQYLKYTGWKNFIYKYKFLTVKNFFKNSKKEISPDKNYEQILDLLKKINFEKQLKKLKKKYKNKKILIYGAGLFFETINNNYDLNGLNIIGISDKNKTSDENVQTLYGYPAVKSADIKKSNPDVILVGVLNPIELIEILKTDYNKIKIEPLVNKGRIEFFEEILQI